MAEKKPDKYDTARAVLTIVPLTMRFVSAELRQLDNAIVPPQLMVLNFLVEGPKNLTQLAELSAVSLPTMSGTVRSLEKEGYVLRKRDEHDRRVTILEITPSGQAMLETIAEKVINRMAHVLEIFSQEELNQIWSGLMVFDRLLSPSIFN